MTAPANHTFKIDKGSAIPLYRQIIDQAHMAVAGGVIKPGEQLPSVSTLATLFGMNRMTVSKAYSQLAAEGLLIYRRGVGMVVAQPLEADASVRRAELLRPIVENAAQAARKLGIDVDQALAMFATALEHPAITQEGAEVDGGNGKLHVSAAPHRVE